MAIFITILLTLLALILLLHFFGSTLFLLALGIMSLALLVFATLRNRRSTSFSNSDSFSSQQSFEQELTKRPPDMRFGKPR
jgi:Mg2+/Co2+ transporter CorB